MATRLLEILLRSALLAAIVASAALYVDYQSGSGGGFCGEVGAGCGQVRSSAYSHIGGVGLPTIGLGVFVGIFSVSLWASKKRHFQILALQCVIAALGALGLIGLQLFVLETICKWCMMVDVGAVVAAGAALALALRPPPVEPRPLRMLWAGAGVVCVAVPLTWETAPPATDVPAVVARYYDPGRVDVVMFTDFECPYCRSLHEVVDEVAAEHDDVLVQRVMVPLRGHVGAEPSALAYLCAPDERREAMADALYRRPTGLFAREEVVALGASLGIAAEPFAACLDDPQVKERLEHERSLFSQAELKGLPSTFVEKELVVGADEATFRAAIERALEGHSAEGGADLRYMFALLALVLLGAAAVSLRSVRAREEP